MSAGRQPDPFDRAELSQSLAVLEKAADILRRLLSGARASERDRRLLRLACARLGSVLGAVEKAAES